MAIGIASTITGSGGNLANWIPTVWAQDVISEVEKNLIFGGLYDRSYEKWAAYGDKIVVPRLAEIAAQVVNFDQTSTTYKVEQNAENISIDQKFDISVMMDDLARVETNPKYFEKVRSKMAYGLAKVIDINCANALRSANTVRGTIDTALTEEDLIQVYEDLNVADAPISERAWAFDPESISDLMKLDYFVRMDYVPGSVSANGFQGRQIFGSPVYMTTNLFTHASGAHLSGYFHREYEALVVQLPAAFEIGRIGLQHSDFITGLAAWGFKTMRPTFGAALNCRS